MITTLKSLRAQCDDLQSKHRKLSADHRVLNAILGQLKEDDDQLRKANDRLRKQHSRDLKNEQIAWCKRKEAPSTNERQSKKRRFKVGVEEKETSQQQWSGPGHRFGLFA